MTSKFIVIDGIDGCGKGEMVRRLANHFREKEFNVIVTAEPTNGEFGRQAKQLLKDESDPLKSSLKILDLFIKDRELHVKNLIEPHLMLPNTIVICDRYYYSTIAYQAAQGIDKGMLIDMNSDFRKPDLAFILDLPVEMALERIGIRGEELEKFEKREIMEKVRANFVSLKDILADNLVYIDASKTKEEVFEEITSRLN